jgi:hypothetical protein
MARAARLRHWNVFPFAFPCSSTSHSNTAAVAFGGASFGDVVQ